MADPTVNPRPAWAALESILRAEYQNPDIEAAKIFYSAIAAHRITQHPACWLLLIAPSGSMKTDLIETVRGLPDVYLKDEVTARTFISGKIDERRARKQPASFLHRMGEQGILASGDFSTFACKDPRELKAILSQLRRIYDGYFSREFGSDENMDEREWSGRMTFLAGATPDIDLHFRVFQLMGERFVRVRWPRADGVRAGVKALRHTGSLRLDLRAAAAGLLLPLLKQPSVDPPLVSDVMASRISNLSEIVCLARTSIVRDNDTREITLEPTPEGNTRLPQELAQVGRGWAALNGRQEVGDEEFELIRRAALDSIPPARRKALATIEGGESPYGTSLTRGVVSRSIEELLAVGLIREGSNGGCKFQLADSAKSLISQVDGNPHFFVCTSGEEGLPDG